MDRLARAFCLLALPCLMADAQEAQVVRVPLSPGSNAIGLSVTPGDKPHAQITLEYGGGGKRVLALAVQSQSGKRRKTDATAKPEYEDAPAPDSFVTVSGLNLRLFARPNLFRYTDAQQDELLARWETLPGAARTSIHFEFRAAGEAVELWINGAYAGVLPAPGGLRAVAATLPASASARGAAAYALPFAEPRYLALDISRIAKPGAWSDARPSLAKGPQRIGEVPLLVADGAGNGDVGVVREMKGAWALECDEHLARSPFDGMPETLHLSVPKAFYHKAYVLCAVEPDAAKEPVLTLRMTRFARSGRGDAITHSAVTLPRAGAPLPSNVKRVGSVTQATAGRVEEVPLYLAELDLDPGAILDLVLSERDTDAPMLDGRYLDIDLLGRVQGVKPVRGAVSGVHVFGLTLERSPAEFSLHAAQPGNLFAADQKPETTVQVKPVEPCDLTLTWRITDIDGAVLREAKADLACKQIGEPLRRLVDLSVPRPGWYGLRFTLAKRGAARPFLTHQAALALLGPDRRKAGYDSPYGVWWFAGAHYGCADVATIGPILHKAGFRKTTFGWTQASEADFAPWQVTLNQIGWVFRPDDIEGSARKIAEWTTRFPHCKSILIFHESYGNYLPAELFGGKPEESAETVAAAQKRVGIATAAARLFRERFPDLKIIIGNTSASAAIIASLLRHGFDPSLVDYIGIETAAGQTGMPEKLWEGGPQGSYLARDVARRMGHDLPLTGCYEFTTRCERNLGPQRHAEFYARDVLMAQAYRYQHISPGLIHDAGNAYNHTLWGGGGLLRRHPLLYPKPAYVALAALTNVLDQVTFSRQVPTGSLTTWCHEYSRADGRYAYALWTPRATVELELTVPAGTTLEHSDFYGAFTSPAAPGGRLRLKVGPAPRYLLTSKPLAGARVVGQITEPQPEGYQVADRLDGANAWSLMDDTTLTKTSGELPRHVPGKFSLRPVTDEQRGRCLELELHGDTSLSDYVGEYGVVAPPRPVALPGQPHTLGLWVKGNSSWGKIVFEFVDAAGCVWRTHAGEWHDWQGELSINFDGWHLIRFPIDAQSPVVYSSPGGRCQRTKGGNAAVTWPIAISKLYVVLNRRALDPTEMRDVAPSIRLSAVGGY